MKYSYKKGQEQDQFAIHMLKTYGAVSREAEVQTSPYFLARLRARIQEEHRRGQIWEVGVIKAQRWLIAFSVVALLFFFGNLFAVGTQMQETSLAMPSASLMEDESDYLQPDEEALNTDDFQRE